VSSRFGNEANAFCNHQGQGLWVPAQGRDDGGGWSIVIDVVGTDWNQKRHEACYLE
jgi:hypothetical protein